MDLVILRPHTTSLPACRLENSAWLLLITTIVMSFHVCSKFSDFCFSSLICPGHCRKKNRGGMIKNIWHMRWGGGAVSTAGGRRSAKSSVSNKGEWESICFFCWGSTVLWYCVILLSLPPGLVWQVEKVGGELWYLQTMVSGVWYRQIDRVIDLYIFTWVFSYYLMT